MISEAKITHRFFTESGMYLQLYIPMVTHDYFQIDDKKDTCEVIFAEDNSITSKQRKLIYATLTDIAEFMGEDKKYVESIMKEEYCQKSGYEEISFRDCDRTVASDFIDFLIDTCFLNNIPLNCEFGIDRAYNITSYLSMCLKYSKCCVCGKKADLHHEDAIGMGNDRTRKGIDEDKRKMALCRVHHTERHTIGTEEFQKKYHVYGILWEPDAEAQFLQLLNEEE